MINDLSIFIQIRNNTDFLQKKTIKTLPQSFMFLASLFYDQASKHKKGKWLRAFSKIFEQSNQNELDTKYLPIIQLKDRDL